MGKSNLRSKAATIPREKWLELTTKTTKKLAKKIACANAQRAAYDGDTMTRNQRSVNRMTRSQLDPTKGELGVIIPQNGASKTDTRPKAVLPPHDEDTEDRKQKQTFLSRYPNQINATD
jgi:hypothetical protein